MDIKSNKYFELLYNDIKNSIPIYFKTQHELFLEILTLQNLTFRSSYDYVDLFKSSFPFLENQLSVIEELIYDNIINTEKDLMKVFKCGFKLSTYLSDPHNNWNVVRIVTLDNKEKYVYKKGHLHNYFIYEKFINKFRAYLPDKIKFLGVKNYECSGFLLQEYIDSDNNFNDIDRFNYQIGFLSILLYLLSATDAHFENIILSKEGIKLVDLESIFQPLKKKDSLTEDFFIESIYTTGILPFKINIPNKGDYDFSPISKNNWFSLPANFIQIDEIRIGMKDSIKFINTHRENLLAYFFSLKKKKYLLRVTLKPTICYGMVFNKLSELEWKNPQEIISKALKILNTDSEYSEQIMKIEAEMILKFQIPIFYTYNDSRDLICKTIIENYFEQSGIDRAISRLKKINIKNIKDVEAIKI